MSKNDPFDWIADFQKEILEDKEAVKAIRLLISKGYSRHDVSDTWHLVETRVHSDMLDEFLERFPHLRLPTEMEET